MLFTCALDSMIGAESPNPSQTMLLSTFLAASSTDRNWNALEKWFFHWCETIYHASIQLLSSPPPKFFKTHEKAAHSKTKRMTVAEIWSRFPAQWLYGVLRLVSQNYQLRVHTAQMLGIFSSKYRDLCSGDVAGGAVVPIGRCTSSHVWRFCSSKEVACSSMIID